LAPFKFIVNTTPDSSFPSRSYYQTLRPYEVLRESESVPA
jgi:hypothetical protein